MSGGLRLIPCTVKAARKMVRQWHRHLPDVQGGLFAVAVAEPSGDWVGVAVAGNPSRVWQGEAKLVISRVAALDNLPAVVASDGKTHAAPACTMLYSALCRAAKALGYEEAWTYTLPDELGVSLQSRWLHRYGTDHWRRTQPPLALSSPSRAPRAQTALVAEARGMSLHPPKPFWIGLAVLAASGTVYWIGVAAGWWR